MKIAIVGAAGQLGSALVHECSESHDVVPLTRRDLDITDDEAVRRTLESIAPAAIINCASDNDVDGAEDRPVKALDVNAFAVRTIAHVAECLDAVLVHFSTDFVFDGTASTPYTEQDPPGPRSAYAVSKLLGEWFAQDVQRAYVLRVESLFGRPPLGVPSKGTVVRMAAAMRAGAEVTVFDDRTVSPTYIADAARATRLILETAPPSGLYHCVSSGECTWTTFATELARRLGVEPRLKAIKMSEAVLRADRPQYSVLSNAKLRGVGIEMPSWQDAVARYAQEVVMSYESES